MKTVIFAATAAACIALSAPAFAQDQSTPFTGAHIEGLAGYDAVKTNSNGLGTPGGFLYGVGLGYDLRAGGAIVGLEGELSDSTASRAGIDAARDLYVGARVGVPVSKNVLAYVKAGYSNARIEGAGLDQNGSGVRVGAGLEYDLGNKLFAKTEYRYTNYEQDVERHQVLGGVGIRF